jgi:hypothetical protein
MWDANGVPVGATNSDGSPYTKVDPNGPGALGTGASQGDFPTEPEAFGGVTTKKPKKAFDPLAPKKGVSWSGPDPRGNYQSGRIDNTPESEQMYNAPTAPKPATTTTTTTAQPGANGLMALARTYAGPVGVSKGGRFGAKYLQARLYGMSKATVNPRVNQMKTMNSPEFAAAKAMGLSVPYSSGGESMVDVTGAERDLQVATDRGDTYGQRNAQARLDRFDQGMADSGGDTAMYDSGLTPSPRRIPKATRSASELPAINDGSQDIDSEYAGMDSGSEASGRARGDGAGLTDGEARGRNDRYSPFVGQRTR